VRRKEKREGAEDGYDCWLRYGSIEDEALRASYRKSLPSICLTENGAVIESAREELVHGIRTMTGFTPAAERDAGKAVGIALGTLDSMRKAGLPMPAGLAVQVAQDGYLLHAAGSRDGRRILLAGRTQSGALRGGLSGLSIADNPANPIRMIDHWDNMDGTIERGYAGRSIFFKANRVVKNLSRVRDYARLLASVGISAVAINNVNVHAVESRLITAELLPDVARIAEVLRAWGIRLFLSVNYAAPVTVDSLPTADPLDPAVRRWWSERASEIYSLIPDFGGFLVKADSEGRPGPFTYGRDHAEGANMLAEALAPHGGLVFWRCFVYNCRQDWRDRSTDRARAAFENFMPLDGRFADNVLLQIKNGPMDFQVREPVSPLFGGMERTNQALELQITQEYTGQQRHLCCLVPQWKEYLDFDTHAPARGERGAEVKRIADGSAFARPLGAVVGVSNMGDDRNWTGHDLAQANLFGFGRLAWNPDLSSDSVIGEWARLTFGADAGLQAAVTGMLAESWSIYESYTAPLGVGWMVNPGHHYGPSVDGYEYSRWGTYHFADCRGIGVDRSAATGSGFAAQYRPSNAAIYESLQTCPDELLLFFHHVPYTHRLRSGKTVIQHIYDSHFDGARRAADLLDRWLSLRGKIDGGRWNAVRERLKEQCAHAGEWRDVVNTYFLRKSGIPDEKGRTIY
jgi:alpha-glucuronidase